MIIFSLQFFKRYAWQFKEPVFRKIAFFSRHSLSILSKVSVNFKQFVSVRIQQAETPAFYESMFSACF